MKLNKRTLFGLRRSVSALSLIGPLAFGCGTSTQIDGAQTGGADSGSDGGKAGAGGEQSSGGSDSGSGGKASSSGGKGSSSGGNDSSSGGKNAGSGGKTSGVGGDAGGTSGSAGLGGTAGDGGGSATGGAPAGIDCDFLSDIVIKTQEELDSLVAEGCATIDVSVSIEGATVTSLAGLEPLREIKGSFQLVAWNVTDLAPLGNLQHVKEDLRVRNLEGAPKLVLNSLLDVGGVLEVTQGSMTQLALPKLVHAGQIGMSDNSNLQTISMDQLTTVDRLTINYNPELLTLGGLPSLTTVTKMGISVNPKLPQCEVDQLASRVGGCSGCTDNDDSATCN